MTQNRRMQELIALESTSDGDLSSIKMDWRQTIDTVIFSCKSIYSRRCLGYELTLITNSRLLFKIIFEDEIIKHELHLRSEIEWPPIYNRNLETLKVEFTCAKRERRPWMNLGHQITSGSDVNISGRLKIYREYRVIANEPLSNQVHLLIVQAKDHLQIVPIGRHVMSKITLVLVLDKNIQRPYTPVPPYLHDDDKPPNYTPNCLCLMIKKYPNGLLSRFLTALKVDQTLYLSNSMGSFVMGTYDRYSVIHMLAGGTGLTPMLSIIERAMARRSVRLINLLNFNTNEESMFYVKQLERVSGEKLKVIHILSQPKSTWTGKRGMVSEGLLNNLVGKSQPDACVFTCGPRNFMQIARTSLRELEWKSYQMHEFV
ncbi:cytochrome b5 reductase 4-like [Frieseomelitta varia]|uniref:cytochrome b5 reductase 4-like n=1 Tax=Frieseomelitta varia TaxID=561572 RepID=UPI001CB681B2|nr:cytochrome b5 reductase 4-like [Frieseomelitta varia]